MKYVSSFILFLVSALFWAQDLLFRLPNEDSAIVLMVKATAVLFTVAFGLSLVSVFIPQNKAFKWASALFGLLGLGTFAYRIFFINRSDLTDPIFLFGSLIVFMVIALPVAFAFYKGLRKPAQRTLAVG